MICTIINIVGSILAAVDWLDEYFYAHVSGYMILHIMCTNIKVLCTCGLMCFGLEFVM